LRKRQKCMRDPVLTMIKFPSFFFNEHHIFSGHSEKLRMAL
jgi:hypothetical protein